MAITGNLQTMQLAELLQWLSQGRKTGTLVIDDGRFEKRIYFRAGKVASSASTDPREYLGQFLVGHGHISEDELSAAIRMQEDSGTLIGEILVSIGAIGEAELSRLLRLKAEETIYDVFTWPTGEFRFLDDELPERLMIPIDLEVTGIVLEGVRRLDEWARIRETVPTFDAVPVLVGEVDDLELDPAERLVFEHVDDQSSLAEIRERSRASEFTVGRAVFEAVRRGRAKLVLPPWARGERPAGVGAAEVGKPGAAASEPVAPAVIDAAALLAAARVHLAGHRYAEAIRSLRAARELEPDNPEIRAAVGRAEGEVRGKLDAAGIRPDAVPRLVVRLEELTASKLTREEGFILSRVDGSYDVASILKISSLGELEALATFQRLVEAGVLALDAPRAVRR